MAVAAQAINLMCFTYHAQQGVERPLIPVSRLDLSNLPSRCIDLFRFDQPDLLHLAGSLGWMGTAKTKERDHFFQLEGLCLVLRRLVFPVRFLDCVSLFGRSVPALSRMSLRAARAVRPPARVQPAGVAPLAANVARCG